MKIDALGITGEVFKWIEDWLKDREQRVVLLGSNSEWTRIKELFLRIQFLGLFCHLMTLMTLSVVIN